MVVSLYLSSFSEMPDLYCTVIQTMLKLGICCVVCLTAFCNLLSLN